MNKNKCEGCLFLGYFEDMGASTPLCVRADDADLLAAIRAHDDPNPCPWHITTKQVKQLQGPHAPAPGVSDAEVRQILKKIQDSEKGAAAFRQAMEKLGEAARCAATSLGECFALLAQAIAEAGVDIAPSTDEEKHCCGNCKHTDKSYRDEPCDECMDGDRWEAQP